MMGETLNFRLIRRGKAIAVMRMVCRFVANFRRVNNDLINGN